jgi:hypothetical protein
MENNKDTRPKNNKGKYHGYQEWYRNGKIILRGNAKNDQEIGYQESHSKYFNYDTSFYIK